MRMICDTPYILDPECRVCPKLAELGEILEELLTEPGTKILVFSEWERMLDLVREKLQETGTGFAWHTGAATRCAASRRTPPAGSSSPPTPEAWGSTSRRPTW
jgi:SNF2 family DNA or RNA helicase